MLKTKSPKPVLTLIQKSKEYFNGKWQMVGFYKKGKDVIVKPLS
jgi:hypothetical protein